jgi:hypothetical protein
MGARVMHRHSARRAAPVHVALQEAHVQVGLMDISALAISLKA